MYKDLLTRFLKENKLSVIIFTIVASIILPLESIGFTNYFTYIIDEYRKRDTNLSLVYKYIFIIIIIYFISRFLASIELYFESILDIDIMKFIRNKMFDQVIEKYKKRYSEVEIGKLVSNFTILPDKYQDLIYRFLKEILPRCIAILILNIYFYTLHWSIGLAITLFFIVYIITISKNIKKCQQLKSNKYSHIHKMNEKLSDRMTNIFSILVNGQGVKEKKRNMRLEQKQREISFNSNMADWKLDTLLSFIQVVFFLLIMLLYVFLLRKNKNLRLIASIMIFIYIIAYLDTAKWYLVNYFNIKAVIKDFEKELYVKDKVILTGDITKGITRGFIEFKDISFSYQHKLVLNKLNLQISPNQITSIIGKSGSGKSTLVKLLIGILPPTYGDIYIDNINIKKFNPDYLHQNISMVSQDVKLFNDTVYNNIKYGNIEVSNDKINKIVDELSLMKTVFKNLKFGLQSNVGVSGSELSNGQRQVILILRGYLQDKKIMILDEPTTALDPTTKEVILRLIKKISKDRTIIIVTHDFDTKRISNKIINLSRQRDTFLS